MATFTGFADKEALAAAQEIVYAKRMWTNGGQAQRDAAVATANKARDRLRSLGYGWVADRLAADTTVQDADLILLEVEAEVKADGSFTSLASPAPTAGGTPGAGGGAVDPIVNPASGGRLSDLSPTWVADNTKPTTGGGIVQTVTGAISNAVSGIGSAINQGAQGTGAAAGGLAQTVVNIAKPLLVILLPIIGIWAAMKIFRIRLNLGGR